MDTILTVQKEDLERLNPEEAVEVFRKLLRAEATRIGIPSSRINVSLRIDVPDKGIDASVRADDIPVGSGLIESGLNSYQVKTGTSFEPWQESQVRRELFSNKPPRKQNLAGRVRDCLDEGGRYVLVCFGQDLVDPRHADAIGHLRSYFEECGYRNARVNVFSQNQLIGFVQPFPALALELNRQPARFETYREWARQDEMQRRFIAGEAQNELISGIQAELRQNERPVHIRVLGEAGIGKTKLVLEATGTEDLQPLVVYCDAASWFRGSNLMTAMLRGEYSAILVLDECNPDDRAYIWNKLRSHSPRVKLVSIYNEYEAASGDIRYFDVPPLEREQISGVIQDYDIPRDIAYGWAAECSGSPRVAHVVGLNLKYNPEDLLKPPDTVNIWDRYIAYTDDPASEEVRQRRLVLRYISLFKRFGYVPAFEEEALTVADMIQRADQQITWARFQEIINYLRRDRRLLQGENTLYITPKLLHVKLWIEWWEIHRFSLDELTLLPRTLLDWYFQMFEYAAGSPAASRVAREILEALFQQSPDYLNTEFGSRFFRYLAIAEPEPALRCLKNTIGAWSKDELLQFKTGRINLVWALEEIARRGNLFQDAARLLLALGEAENEAWSNNASRTFVELFPVSLLRQLSRTEASPEERFPIIREALESDSKERRLLALRACEQVLIPQHWGVGAYVYRIVGKPPEPWMPKTYGEVWSAYRQVWRYLAGKVDDLPKEERQEAVDVLLRTAGTLSQIKDLSDMIIDTMNELSRKPYVDKRQVLETAIRTLSHHGKDLPDKTKLDWTQLKEELTGTDFSSLMKRYVGMDLVEDKLDEEFKQIDRAGPRIEELAQQAINEPELLRPELDWLVTTEAENGYRFGHELGKRDEAYSLLPSIVEALKEASGDASAYLLGGYFRILCERDESKWEEQLDILSQDEKLRVWVPELTWRSGIITDKAALRILALAKEDIVDIGHLRMFSYGRVIRQLSEDAFREWVEFLLSHPDDRAVYIALDLYSFYYVSGESQHRLPEELTLKLLTSPSLSRESEAVRDSQMSEYHWTLIGTAFAHLYPARSLEIAEFTLEHFARGGTIFERYGLRPPSLLTQIAAEHPEEVWEQIVKYIGPPIDMRALAITQWLRGVFGGVEETAGALTLFPGEIVWQWVDEDVEERARYLATFVPKRLFREEGQVCWAREVLVRYGKREDVRSSLSLNFRAEGWIGPESLHLENKKKKLLDFEKEEDNENVKQWIDEFVSELERRIKRARDEEEREDY